MKQAKRFTAFLIAVLMVTGMTPAALAEDGGGATPAASVREETQNATSPPRETEPGGEETTGPSSSAGTQSSAPEKSDTAGESFSVGNETPPPATAAENGINVQAASAPVTQMHDFGEGRGEHMAIVLYSGDELAKIGSDPAYPADGKYFLNGPINVSSSTFETVTTEFNGWIDGCGKNFMLDLDADDMVVNYSEKYSMYYLTLFKTLGKDAFIENLVLASTVNFPVDPVNGHSGIASALALENYGTLDHVIASCEVNSAMVASGLVSYNYGTMNACEAGESAKVKGTNACGLVYHSEGVMYGCENHAEITGATAAAGVAGIVGGEAACTGCKNYGKISSGGSAAGVFNVVQDKATVVGAENRGVVETSSTGYPNEEAGGIAGELDGKASIIDSANFAPVSGTDKVGGIVGYIGPTDSYECYVKNCTNWETAPVTGTGGEVGGIVGLSRCGVMDCSNYAAVTGKDHVGGVIGNNGNLGNAQGLYNYGDVTGVDYVGGVVGETSANGFVFKAPIGLTHAIALSGNYGAVVGTGDCCGGVAGATRGHYVELFFNMGNVSGNIRVGGITGDSDCDVTDCLNTGNISGSEVVGGLAGDMSGTPEVNGLKNSYTAGRVSGREDVGALIGTYNGNRSSSYSHDVYYNTDLTGSLPPFGNRDVGGHDSRIEGRTTDQMTGEGLRDELGDDVWHYNTTPDYEDDYTTRVFWYPFQTDFAVTPGIEVVQRQHPSVRKHDFESQTLDGVQEPVYERFSYIETADDLYAAAQNPNQNYVLANDIILSGEDNLPVLGGDAGFGRKLDGLGHTVSGISSGYEHVDQENKTEEASGNALVRFLNGGRVMNLTLSGNIWCAQDGIAAFVDRAADGSVLYNCINNVEIGGVGYTKNDSEYVDKGDFVGGIVSTAYGTNIRMLECENRAKIVGSSQVGGIVGQCVDINRVGAANAVVISGCSNTGELEGSSYVGGIVGQLDEYCVTSNCVNNAMVSASHDIGGIAGGIYGDVIDCINNESASVVGKNHYVGGIVGRSDGNITGCSNSAAVSGDESVGGIAGYQGYRALSGCVNKGAVSGRDTEIGGIVGHGGYGSDNVQISASFNAGEVSGGDRLNASSCIGGIAGCLDYAEVQSCFNAGDIMTSARYTGGLVGRGPDLGGLAIAYSASTGTISVSKEVKVEEGQDGMQIGGLTGRLNTWNGDTLKYCFFAGKIEAPDTLKCVAAIAVLTEKQYGGRFYGCYHNTDLCKRPSALDEDGYLYRDGDYIIGLETAEMTGADALGAGKMEKLRITDTSGEWTAKGSEAPVVTDTSYTQTVYYPLPTALKDMGVPWPQETVAQSTEHQASPLRAAYNGLPVPYTQPLETVGSPAYSALYAGKDGTEYDLTMQPPTDAGSYYAFLTVSDPIVTPRLWYAALTIEKAQAVVTVKDAERLVGEQNPAFTFTATGLASGETVADLDKVVWETTANEQSAAGTYPITLKEAADNNYEITEGTPGKLTVKQNSTQGRYEIDGQKGVNGHDGWYLSPVTIRPNGTDGYDLISADGQSWKEELTVSTDTVEENKSVTLALKKSATGAYTSLDTISLPVSRPLGAESYSPVKGSAGQSPENTVFSIGYGDGIEKRSDGKWIRIYAGDTLFEEIPLASAQITIENTGGKGTLTIKPSKPLPTNARISVETDETGAVCNSKTGASAVPIAKGEWMFTTGKYGVTLSLTDLTATYNGAAHAVTPTVTTAAGVVKPGYTVTYEGTGETVYPKTKTPPKNAGTYQAAATVDDPDYEAASDTCTLTIGKKTITLAADDQQRLVGEQNPAFTFTAAGLAAGEAVADLDKVIWETTANEQSAVGAYPITLKEAADNNYDILSGTEGTLSVKQDGAGGRYVISGPKGGNGHDDWYVGEATIRPNGREGYDLISDDGGVTWKSMLTITSDTPQQVSKTILLKKSATGAITSAATETLNVYSTPLALESLSPANGTAAYDPSDATLTLRFSQPVEKGRGYFTIYDTDGAEFAQLNVHALRVRISLDGKTVTLRLPDSFAPNTAYYVTAGAGTLYSQWGYRFAGLKKGDWQFETAPSSDTVRITDLILAVEGESAERKAVYTGKPDADYTAAVVPRADGTEELTVSPKVSGVVSEETVSLTLKAVVMEDPAASSVGKVSINGTHVFIGTGVRSVTLQVDAHGQVESDSATIRLVCTGWGAAVIDNETGFDVQTSNLLEAIVPDDYTIADNEIAIVRLHITELGEAKVDPSERALLLGADDGVIGHYLSIELSVDIFEKNDPSVKLRGEFISVTQNPVVISVLFGDDAPEFVNERMLRLHDGEVDILRAIEKDGAYVFASDLFSTYASAYDILRNITVEQPEHGTLGTDKTQAIKGETVTVTAVAEGGYALSEIRVNGTAITGGTFTMPDEDVRVSAVFTKQQENGNGEQGIGGPGQTGKAAKTGDTAMPLWIWIVIAVIAAAAVVALLRRNRRS